MRMTWPVPVAIGLNQKFTKSSALSTVETKSSSFYDLKKTLVADKLTLKFQGNRPTLFTLGVIPLIQKNTDLLIIPFYQESSPQQLLETQLHSV